MAYTGNSLRVGHVIMHNNELLICTDAVHKTPGNLHAFVQGKFRKVLDGGQREIRFSSTETLERVSLVEKEMQFLYQDGDIYHFMDLQNYDQIELNKDFLADSMSYLLPDAKINVTFYEDTPVGIKLPMTMEFEIIEAEPNIKSASVTASFKNATIETGMNVKVPQFIEAGERIVVNTETGEYVERAKK